MFWLVLNILLGLLVIRIIYFFVWYELRRRRRLRTGAWQLDILTDQCVNGMILPAGSYLIDEESDQDFSCDTWSVQCKSLLAQLSPEQLYELRQSFNRFNSTFPEQQLIDGVHVFYIGPAPADSKSIRSGHFWKWTGGWGSVSHDRGKIECPPGSRLRIIARWVYSKKTYERVFEPHLADMQVEYIEALALNEPVKARWVHVRGVFWFWATVAKHAGVNLLGAAVEVVRARFGL